MKIVCIFVSVVVVAAIGSCFAAVPQKMNYQGKLTDAGGKLVPDGSYDMIFSLYAAETGGTQEWAETWSGGTAQVQVTNGTFNVLLGTHTALGLPFDETYWLQIQVKSGGSYETLSPRQQIVSAGYSFRSKEADSVKDNAITLDKLDTSTIMGIDSLTGKVTGDGSGLTSLPPHPIPAVSGVNPYNKVSGYSSFIATITGQNFQSVSRAKIGSTDLTGEDVSSSTSMTATVPSGIAAGTHDVSVSNIDLAWGTGSGLFEVIMPTPTPTITPTGTPTATPTWGQTRCEAKGGLWRVTQLTDNDDYGCWITDKVTLGLSCNTICQNQGLACLAKDWNDTPTCSICIEYYSPNQPCDHDQPDAYMPNYYVAGATYCYTRHSNATAQDCTMSTGPGRRLCVCSPQ